MLYTISGFQISRLTNAEATAFFLNVQKAIVEAESESLALESQLVSNFNATLKKLIDQVYVAQGSQYTAVMATADATRTQIYKRIRLRLQMVEVADDNMALSACKDVVVKELLSKYRADVTRMAVQSKTAVISGFIYDLTSKLNEDDMEALGIEGDISALTQANNSFISAYNARSAERAAGDTQVTIKLRSEMGEFYQTLCFVTQANANSFDPEKATLAAASQSFIGVLNVYLADAKKRYLQRTGHSTDEQTDEEQNAPGNGAGNASQGAGGTDNPADSGNSGGSHIGDIPDDVVFPGM